MSTNWKIPCVGDIVWCLFSEVPDTEPGPKPRPAMVLKVEVRDDGASVQVAYGTSKHLNRLKTGEVAITKSQHSAAYSLAGLAYDTKFDFKVLVNLPWTDQYFKVLTLNKAGNTPKIGTLHASVMHAVEAAYRAAMAR